MRLLTDAESRLLARRVFSRTADDIPSPGDAERDEHEHALTPAERSSTWDAAMAGPNDDPWRGFIADEIPSIDQAGAA